MTRFDTALIVTLIAFALLCVLLLQLNGVQAPDIFAYVATGGLGALGMGTAGRISRGNTP